MHQKGMIDYAWNYAVISDQLYHEINKNCNFSLLNVTEACDKTLDKYFDVYYIIDMSSLYVPRCFNNTMTVPKGQFHRINKGSSPNLFLKSARF